MQKPTISPPVSLVLAVFRAELFTQNGPLHRHPHSVFQLSHTVPSVCSAADWQHRPASCLGWSHLWPLFFFLGGGGLSQAEKLTKGTHTWAEFWAVLSSKKGLSIHYYFSRKWCWCVLPFFYSFTQLVPHCYRLCYLLVSMHTLLCLMNGSII